ncbi:MAG: hypothetical protein LBM77_04790 [Spirochaetaceae bacterium]|jgi:hypothetical protein|nr:hypothetical protein [Spirochaetaceae bacterium]
MTHLRKIGVFIIFVFCTISSLWADPQSFFLSPGQTITNRDIKRGYCLEYSKKELSVDNIHDLSVISGTVTAFYNNGTSVETTLQTLKDAGQIVLQAYNSYQHLGFIFTDSTLSEILIGNEGITFQREDMTELETRMTEENRQKILRYEDEYYPHYEIQELIWRTRLPDTIVDNSKITINFNTSTPDKAVTSTFNKTSTVNYTFAGSPFLRVDGLLNTSTHFDENMIELITHYHSDHFNQAVAKRILNENSYNHILAPAPSLASSKNTVFDLLKETGMNTEILLAKEILEVSLPDTALKYNIFALDLGNFYYSKFSIADKIYVEMYKYKYAKTENDESVIYRITHKNISYLLFGDFDNPDALASFIETAEQIELQRISLKEYDSDLFLQLKKNENLQQDMSRSGYSSSLTDLVIVDLKLKREQVKNALSKCPSLKADIVKWPHHAHKFSDNMETDELITRMYELIQPQYIMYQTHPAQTGGKFEDYISRFDFSDKFKCTDSTEYSFISMILFLNNNFRLFG